MKQLLIIGHAGKDVQSRKSTNGNEFHTFTIAENDKDGKTTWFSVVVNGKPKVLEFITKGKQLLVQGDIKIGVFNGEPDITIYASNIQLLGKKDEETPDTY